MSKALVRVDNTMVWDGQTQPFYEVYYLKCASPQGDWSLWLRYTLCTPEIDNPRGIASLWAIFTDRDRGVLALKKKYPLDEFDVMHSDHFIQIDDSYLSLAEASGHIENDSAQIKWDLVFEDPVLSLRPYPWYFYKLKFPRTKFYEPRLKNFISGTFYVNDRKIDVRRIPVHQSHFFGTEYANRWVWGNCISFDEDPEAFFDGMTAQISRGNKLSRPLSVFNVGFAGKIYQSNGLYQIFRGNRSNHDFDSWQLAFKKAGYLFEADLRRDPRWIAGVKYDGPNGEERYCYNSGLGSIDLRISQRKRGQWQLFKHLTNSRTCTWETVDTEKKNGFEIIL